MTKAEKNALDKDRLNKLIANGKNVKSPGVTKKIARNLRKICNE